MGSLIERLRAKHQIDTGNGQCVSVCDPDKVEAAEEITRLTKQRDELVAALDCIGWTRHPGCKLTAKHAEEYEAIAVKALAKVKGEK